MKIIFSFLFLTLSYSSFSQNCFGTTEWKYWFKNFEAAHGGFKTEPELFILYPDTFLVNLFADSADGFVAKPVEWCSIGQNIDPNDSIWKKKSDLDPIPFSCLDSFRVDYGYFRENPDSSVFDTVLFQIFSSVDGNIFKGDLDDGHGLYAVPARDSISGLGIEPTAEYKITLSVEDVTSIDENGKVEFNSLSFILNDEIELDEGDFLHITVHFIPGQPYAAGDTLFFDTALVAKGHKAPKNKLNRFGVMVSVQSPKATPLKSYNNGSFVSKDNRYGNSEKYHKDFDHHYLAHYFKNDSSESAYFPQIGFHNYNYWTGISKSNDFGLTIYPNPVNDILQLDIELPEAARLTTSVLNLTGQIVVNDQSHDLNNGASQVSVDVSSLQPGIYYLKTQGDKGTQMLRFVVE